MPSKQALRKILKRPGIPLGTLLLLVVGAHGQACIRGHLWQVCLLPLLVGFFLLLGRSYYLQYKRPE